MGEDGDHRTRWRAALPTHRRPSTAISPRQALASAVLCAIAGAAATVPLYTTFWWWDLLAHALGGGATVAAVGLLGQRQLRSVASVAVVAVGWEVVEPRLSLGAYGIVFTTGDAPSDIVATVVGGVAIAAALALQ